jgi:hypothetical protein
VTIAATRPAKESMMVRFLGSAQARTEWSGDDALYWRSDVF